MVTKPAANKTSQAGVETPTSFSPTIEVGTSGLKRQGGFVYEEYLPQLRGRKFYIVMDEMGNDPLIGGIMYAIDSLIRQVKWTVTPGGDSPQDEEAKQFLEECMNDMAHTWADFISEILTMLLYGFAPFEIVYKKRQGDVKEGASKFKDGRVGWRKIALRAQSTVDQWVWDESGGLSGYLQRDVYSAGKVIFIPIEKSLLFRTVTRKQNPEGRSIFRAAYRPYFFKKRMEEIEAIGIERDLAGFPMMRIPQDMMSPDATPEQQAVYDDYKRMVRNIRRDEQEGMILPSSRDQTGNYLYDFSLVSSGGSRSFDTSGIIDRYNQMIAMSVLADFILLGHEGVGSFALSSDKTTMFSAALGSTLLSIKEVVNNYAVHRLFKLNGFDLEKLPEVSYGDIETPNLAELGAFITALTGAGMPLFPNEELEERMMAIAGLPYSPEAVKQAQAAQPEAPEAPAESMPTNTSTEKTQEEVSEPTV